MSEKTAPDVATGKISLVLIISLNLMFVVSCALCGDTLGSQATSPDGQVVARVYERDCGATTNFTTQVNVQGSSVKFDATDGVIFGANGNHNVSVTWTGPRTLLVSCPSCLRRDVFLQVAVAANIDVKYTLAVDAR